MTSTKPTSTIGSDLLRSVLEDETTIHIDFSDPEPQFSSVEDLFGSTTNEKSTAWGRRLAVWYMDSERLTLVDMEWAKHHSPTINGLVRDLYSFRVPEDAIVLLKSDDLDNEAKFMIQQDVLEIGTIEFDSMEEAVATGDSSVLEDGLATRLVVRAALARGMETEVPMVDSYEDQVEVAPVRASQHADEW